MSDFMEKGLKALKLAAPIVLAGAVAVIQAIGEQKEQRRINEMDERIKQLESQN